MIEYKICLPDEKEKILADSGISKFLEHNKLVQSELYVIFKTYDDKKPLVEVASDVLQKFALFVFDPIHPPQGFPYDEEVQKAFSELKHLIENTSQRTGLSEEEICLVTFCKALDSMIKFGDLQGR